MEPLPEFQTPDPTVQELLVGEIDGWRSYRTRRPAGTRSWLLIFTLGGAGRIRWDDGEGTAVPGSALLYAPDDPQSYETDPRAGRWNIHWAHFRPRPHWLSLLSWPRQMGPLRYLPVAGEKAFLRFRETLACFSPGDPLSRREAMAHLELTLLACAQQMGTPHPEEDRIRRVAALALASAAPLSVAELANASGLSASRFAHRFREIMGTPPRQYIEQHRIGEAQQLLRLTDLPVREIAARLGFSSEFVFSRRFRTLVGVSPTRYRQG